MRREEERLTLKDGRSCVLRTIREEDAAELLNAMRQTARETSFLARTESDWEAQTVEAMTRRLRGEIDSDSILTLVAEVDGQIVGRGMIGFMTGVKTCHRATVGIGLFKSCWGQGIGTAMMEALLDEARKHGCVQQVELGVIEGNSRARALYEKLGFRLTGIQPGAFRQEDGSLVDEYMMMRKL